jgi:hypothetical protein
MGPGKTTYTLSVTFRFPLTPGHLAWYQQAGRGWDQAAETESTLALAENVYVNLPRPLFYNYYQFFDYCYYPFIS